jgi:uncharacterized protein YndB with AHSA1/START domain
MTAAIHQEVAFEAGPARIFEALTEAKHFSAFTGGAPSEIDSAAGGAFSCFGGMITGRVIEAVPGRRLVQAWRAKDWPEGVYSIVRFELVPDGKGAKLIFDQAGFPDGAKTHLEGGWGKMYWEPLRKYLT